MAFDFGGAWGGSAAGGLIGPVASVQGGVQGSGNNAPGVPSFLTGNQGNAPWWQDPLGYAMFHKSAPPPPSPIQGMSEAEWAYYQSNILPIQENVLRTATDPNTLKQNVAQAQKDVNTQFSQLPGAFQRQMSGLGVTTTPAQLAAFNKQLALSKGIAMAGASNAAARATGIQQRAAIGV